MSLEQFATAAHSNVATINDYLAAGLLPQRSGDVATPFDADDLYWVDMIQCFQENGSSLEELSAIMPRCQKARESLNSVL